MKNKKVKVLLLVSCFCLVLGLCIVGVLSVMKLDFSMGGNIIFNAKGINATISNGTLSESGKFKDSAQQENAMKGFTINTDKTLLEITSMPEYLSWQGLELSFNSSAQDVTISFNVTNNDFSGTSVVISVLTNFDIPRVPFVIGLYVLIAI